MTIEELEQQIAKARASKEAREHSHLSAAINTKKQTPQASQTA